MTRVTACRDCGTALYNDPSLYCAECMVKRISGSYIDLEERSIEDGHGNVTGATVVAVEHRPVGIAVHPSHLPTIVDLLEDENARLKAAVTEAHRLLLESPENELQALNVLAKVLQ